MARPVEIEYLLRDGVSPGLRNIEGTATSMGRTVERESARVGSAFQRMILPAGAAIAAQQFARSVRDVYGELQAMESSFDVLLSGKGVPGFIAALKEFAVDSPLSLTGVTNAAQTLLGFNVEAGRVIPIIRQLGDVSMGNEEKFKSLALAYAQVHSTGKLMGQDLLQMINAGFNPLTVIAEKTGKSVGALKEEMAAGAVSAEMVADAFAVATSEGGKFYGMTEKQAEGIRGLRAQYEGAVQEALNSIGDSNKEIIAGSYKAATLVVQNYEKVGKIILGMVATYGAYRTAVIVATAAEKGWTIAQLAHYNVLLIVEKAQKLLNRTMMANPYILATTLLVGLVATLWALRDSTTAAERAQKEHNDRLGEAKTKFDELISIVRDETKAITDRQEALEKLRKIYPGLFADMDIEAAKLASLADLTKQATLADLDRERVRAEKKIAALDAAAGTQRVKIQHYPLERRSAKKRLAEIEEEKKAQEAIVQAYYDQLDKEEELRNRAAEEAAKAPQNKTYWEGIKKEAQTAIEAMDVSLKGTAEWNRLLGVIANADKEIQKYSGGKSSGPKPGDQTKKDAEELVKLQRQLADDAAQAQVDAMAEGYLKKRAQAELDFEREKADIVRRQEELKALQNGVLTNEQNAQFSNLTRTAASNYASNLHSIDRDHFSWEAEQDAWNEYLAAYGTYEEKRLAITEKYGKLIAEAGTLGEAMMLEKDRDEALTALDVSLAEQSDLWSKLFGDVREMSSKTLKKVIADTKTLLSWLKTPKGERTEEMRPIGFTDEQLDAISGDAEKIKAIYDELIEKQDALDNKSNYAFSNIVKGFGNLKKSAATAAEALLKTDAAERKLFEEKAEAEKGKGLDQLKAGAVELTGFLSGAVAKLKELAEATGNTGLAEFADQAGALLQNLGAAAQGAASGGWIGAIVGGVMDMISQTIEGIIHVKAYVAQLKQSMKEFGYEMKKLELDRLVGNNESAFGKKIFTDTIEQAAKAKEAMRQYEEEVTRRTIPEIEKAYKSLGITIFGFGVSGTFGEFGGLSKSVTNETKVLLAAYEKGYSDLEAMAVKTKDYGGWHEFWGYKDKFTSLKDLAPELWKDGVFDVEAAKAFLETSKQLSDEQRAQIENVISLKDAYDETIAAIDKQIGDMFGFLGPAITDSIVEAIETGGDAWDIFAKKGIEAFENIGEQLAYEIYFADQFAQLQERLRGAVTEGGSPEEVARRQAAMIQEFYNYVKATLPNAEQFMEQWSEQFGAWQGDMEDAAKGVTQSGKAGAFQTMSQDTGTRVEGLFTAMRMGQEDMKKKLDDIGPGLSEATGVLVEIREEVKKSNGWLGKIFAHMEKIYRDGLKVK
jgi:tape measure domain-containing protein